MDAEASKEPFSNAAALVELERGMKTFRSFEHAHKVIEVLNNSDQTLANLKQQISAAESDHKARVAKYQRELDEIQVAVEKGKKESAAAADYDRQVGEQLIANARKEAEGIIGYAKRKLSAAEAGATDADNRRQLYEESISRKRVELVDLNGQIKEAREKIAQILGAA
jgi:uncharacterized protein with von Willebrand factor type A (vWA) domain